MKTSWSGTKPAKQLFVAETEDGEIAGFCNGCCADTDYLADALYHDATLHNPDGDYQMISDWTSIRSSRNRALEKH